MKKFPNKKKYLIQKTIGDGGKGRHQGVYLRNIWWTQKNWHMLLTLRTFICLAVSINNQLILVVVFVVFCVKLRFKKPVKVTEPIFWGNFYCCLKRVNGTFLGPKLVFLSFALNLFIRFFCNCTWWQETMIG